MSLPLAGRRVLVTRPVEQSATLAQGISEAGGEALLFPAIEIQPVMDDALVRQIDRLHEFTLAIFISPNAAQQGVAAVRAALGLINMASVNSCRRSICSTSASSMTG